MKDGDSLPISTSSVAATTVTGKKETGYSALFSKGRYKFWALAAILLLAFWSMLTGTVNLRWSAGNINHFTDDLVFLIHEDLDVLVSLLLLLRDLFSDFCELRLICVVLMRLLGNGGEGESGEAHVGCV